MTEINRIVSNYNAHLEYLIDIANNKYEEAKRNRKAFEELILSVKDEVITNPILTMVHNHVNTGVSYNWNELYKKSYGGLQPTRIVKPYMKQSVKNIVMSYYNSFKSYAMDEITSYKDLQDLIAVRLPKVTLNKLMNDYFITVGKLMLSEPHFDYNINSRLKINIKGKSKRKKRYNYIPKKAPINWGASMKLLKEIAEIENKSVLEDFNNKLIDQKTFIQKMKPYTYNKDTNPNGKQWLVKIDANFGYWLVLYKSSYTTEKEMLYSITPNNNRHVGKPVDEYIFNDLKTVDKVIEDEILGFADKIRGLAKIDNEYCLNTFYNDLQTN